MAEKHSGDPGLRGFKLWQVLLSSDKLPWRAAMRDKGKYIIKSNLFSSLKSCFTWHLIFLLFELKQQSQIYLLFFEVLLLAGRFTTQLLYVQHKQQLSSPASYMRFMCSEMLLVWFKNKCLHDKSEDLFQFLQQMITINNISAIAYWASPSPMRWVDACFPLQGNAERKEFLQESESRICRWSYSVVWPHHAEQAACFPPFYCCFLPLSACWHQREQQSI